MRPRWLMVALAAGGLLLAGCDDDDGSARLAPDDNLRRIGEQIFADHGTRDVRGTNRVSITVDAFYFAPTFLRGEPGQTLTLEIRSEDEQNVHNFTLTLDGAVISRDIPPGGAELIEITFPPAGIAFFFCGFHVEQGMRGELLVGAATPAPVPAP